MKEYKRLAERDRHLRYTAMDALEVLRKEADFQDGDRAKFHIKSLTAAVGRQGRIDRYSFRLSCPGDNRYRIASDCNTL